MLPNHLVEFRKFLKSSYIFSFFKLFNMRISLILLLVVALPLMVIAQQGWEVGLSANFTTLDIEGQTTDINAYGVSVNTPFYSQFTIRTGNSDLQNPFTGETQTPLILALSQGVAKIEKGKWFIPFVLTAEHISATGAFSETFAFSLGGLSAAQLKLSDSFSIRATATAGHRWAKLFTFEQPDAWFFGAGPGVVYKLGKVTFSSDMSWRNTGSSTLVVRAIYSL